MNLKIFKATICVGIVPVYVAAMSKLFEVIGLASVAGGILGAIAAVAVCTIYIFHIFNIKMEM